ncbi:DUF1883 domain-containing protein [Streptomyces sp. NPDC091389]|uniref:DUF1883 domain-containing protein n=1 Tax=Streptomyces sp. NPDC091389 TaxID=3365999 RepID=UPI00381432AF
MDYLCKDLGNLKRGSTVIVTLRNQANVQVMTCSEYSKYKPGKRYRYLGGHTRVRTRSGCQAAHPSASWANARARNRASTASGPRKANARRALT